MTQSVAEIDSFFEITKTAASLLGAAATLTLTFKGPWKWEPAEEDLPMGLRKIGGLLGAIALAILYVRYYTPEHASFLTNLAVGLGALALVSFLIYGALIRIYIYIKKVADTPGKVRSYKIIGGLWLTAAARKALKKQPVIQMIFEGAAYNEDAVWPRPARALSQVLFNLSYLGLVVGGMLALTTASMLILISRTT